VEQFSVVVHKPSQKLPSGPWVSKGWEPLVYGASVGTCILAQPLKTPLQTFSSDTCRMCQTQKTDIIAQGNAHYELQQFNRKYAAKS